MPTTFSSAARTWLDKDGRVALATVVGTWGSAPVRVGGQMVIAADGRSKVRSRAAVSKAR